MAKKHPNKHIRAAVKYAVDKGWEVTISPGHHWGHLWCPLHTREGCIIGVFSTPKNPEKHARRIRYLVDLCQHTQKTEEAPDA